MKVCILVQRKIKRLISKCLLNYSLSSIDREGVRTNPTHAMHTEPYIVGKCKIVLKLNANTHNLFNLYVAENCHWTDLTFRILKSWSGGCRRSRNLLFLPNIPHNSTKRNEIDKQIKDWDALARKLSSSSTVFTWFCAFSLPPFLAIASTRTNILLERPGIYMTTEGGIEIIRKMARKH